MGPCAKGALGLCRGAEEMGDDDVLHHAHALVAQPLPHRGDQHRTLRRRAGHRPRGCNAAVSNQDCHQEFSKRGDRCKGACETHANTRHTPFAASTRFFLVATATQSVCLSVQLSPLYHPAKTYAIRIVGAPAPSLVALARSCPLSRGACCDVGGRSNRGPSGRDAAGGLLAPRPAERAGAAPRLGSPASTRR